MIEGSERPAGEAGLDAPRQGGAPRRMARLADRGRGRRPAPLDAGLVLVLASALVAAGCLLESRGLRSGSGEGETDGRADAEAGAAGDADVDADREPDVDEEADADPDRDEPDGDGSCVRDPPWWDPAYLARVPLVVTARTPAPAGYTLVAARFDHAAAVAAGRARADGRDLRVVRWDGAGWTELARRAWGVGTDTMGFRFMHPEAIPDRDESCFLYLGNPGAADPPEEWSDSMGAAPLESPIYLGADGFDEHPEGVCPDGWEPCSGDFSTATDGLRRYVESAASDRYLVAGDPSWGDVLVEAILWSPTDEACWGIATRVESVSDLVFSGYNCGRGDPWYLPTYNAAVWPRVAGGYTPILHGEIAAPGGSWHRIGIAWVGSTFSLVHAGAVVGSAEAPPEVASTGRVALFSSYGTGFRADEITVRRYVRPEPSVVFGEAEARCPPP